MCRVFCDESGKNSASFGYVGPDKMGIAFTCNICETRNVKKISRQAYQHGVVIVQCSGCNGRHIIADNLGWYAELTQGRKNVEELAAAAGQQVTKINDERIFELENALYAKENGAEPDTETDTEAIPIGH